MNDNRPDDMITLDNLGRGAAIEKFQTELQRTLDNIVDPNTKATAVRSITLKLTIKPDKDRDIAQYKVDCAAKLAPDEPFEGKIFLGKVHGQAVAAESHQKALFEERKGGEEAQQAEAAEMKANVVPIRKEGSA